MGIVTPFRDAETSLQAAKEIADRQADLDADATLLRLEDELPYWNLNTFMGDILQIQYERTHGYNGWMRIRSTS